ncbi:HXXEE domain-containing protein [Uliginosibacterium sp. H3]|uniref:HXXEE domain-containing protein n=1 Tax=Uliginosibacterium silvisoli TaxID=3114758 RepID=A0ABU6K6U7_9RHOO|nr:HXXEE domain-containing protein [Uliginosibacterium sp. H3]
MQTQHWFYTVWPFIGIGGAIVMFVMLLATDTFRASTTVSRWRDPEWLAWLAVPFYWVHQFEEYSLPTIGLPYSIQEMICEKIGFPPYPDCPIPLAFYPVVNIALMWFGAPLAAYIFRRNVLIGLSFWGLLFANGFVHTFGGIAAGAYNTGLWSALFLFIPFSLWVIYVSAIRGPYSGKVVGTAYAAGALTHTFLFMGYGLYKAGLFGDAGLLAYAALVGFMPIILAAIASKFFKPESLRPVPPR